MSRKREAVFMGLGILAGLTLSGPAAQAADYLTARPSTQPIYVDGQRISMTAYNIGGNNYVKLRDIGKAVNFGVIYDAATNSVHIDSTQPYQEEVPAAPSGPTEESVQAALQALRRQYPHGTLWPSPYHSTSGGPYSRGINCSGWATLCSDAAFGDLPVAATHSDFDAIRVGDLLRINHDTHTVIVLEKRADSVIVAEGNYNRSIHWDRELSRKNLEDGDFTVRSRWEQ